MFETISIPLWVVWLIGLLALIAVLDRILMPTVQWYLRRRLNAAVAILNKKLQLKIPQFKLTNRYVVIDRLLNDPQVLDGILKQSQKEKAPLEVIERRARKYALEIVPSFSAIGYFGWAYRLTRWLSTLMYHVHLTYHDKKAFQDMSEDATVVFVMNHRSNMDYILVTYLAASRSALSYAVGEWARVWPLKQLIRSTGAYFIRRREGTYLYRKVLAGYVQMATQAGVTQAIFPEGGLTRDGFLKAPKSGLLSYIISGFDMEKHKDILFVPVGVNYDRVIEDRVMLDVGEGKKVSGLGKIIAIFHAIKWYFWLRFVTDFKRFGYAGVAFGTPVSLSEFLTMQKNTDVLYVAKRLNEELFRRIGTLIPILPVALLARIFLRHKKTKLTWSQIEKKVEKDLDKLIAKGGMTGLSKAEMRQGLKFGVSLLKRRRIIDDSGGKYTSLEEGYDILEYYANSIHDIGK